MSQENVEIVRRVYESAARRDTASVLADYDAEVEYDFSRSPFADVVNRALYRGHDGVRSFFRERSDFWATVWDDCMELIDAGDHVISVVISRGRGRASGVEVGVTHHGVWTIREGKVVRVAWFGSRSEALEAVGLRE